MAEVMEVKALNPRLLGRSDECMGYTSLVKTFPLILRGNLLSTSPALEDNGTWRAVPFLVSGSRATRFARSTFFHCSAKISPLRIPVSNARITIGRSQSAQAATSRVSSSPTSRRSLGRLAAGLRTARTGFVRLSMRHSLAATVNRLESSASSSRTKFSERPTDRRRSR